MARFSFQACSFNHSDISPFRISSLRPPIDPESRDCDTPPNVPRSLAGLSSIAAAETNGHSLDERVEPTVAPRSTCRSAQLRHPQLVRSFSVWGESNLVARRHTDGHLIGAKRSKGAVRAGGASIDANRLQFAPSGSVGPLQVKDPGAISRPSDRRQTTFDLRRDGPTRSTDVADRHRLITRLASNSSAISGELRLEDRHRQRRLVCVVQATNARLSKSSLFEDRYTIRSEDGSVEASCSRSQLGAPLGK